MAAGLWKVYESAKEYLADGTFDLDDNTNWKMALFLSTSNANDLAASDIYGELTNEHANGGGYTTLGEDITPTWAQSAGTATLDSDDAVWTASGGSILARFAVIYKNATVNSIVKPLLCVCLLDAAPADVEATDGNTLTVQINASGIVTLSGATTDA
jgi:hypothetical protein